MGLESFGRTEEEAKDLADVELSGGEERLSEARQEIIDRLVGVTGVSEERVLGILKSVNSSVESTNERTVYNFEDKGHKIYLSDTKGEWDIGIDGKAVKSDKVGQLKERYRQIIDAYHELRGLTVRSREFSEGTLDELLAP
ncbi:MAG: hypothetical protein KBC02_01220 [Candidatus Pacebacteria bacterium]|nr:hypothetical protein [Candidatus Paceibacterota bacterium]